MRVVVIGLGYVGLPLAMAAVEAGHSVVGVDLDETKLSSLRSGDSYIEDISDIRLDGALTSGRLKFAHGVREEKALDEFEIGIIAVPTPLRGRVPDLSYVESASRLLGRHLRRGAGVVLESTTYPGTTEGLVQRVVLEESGLQPPDYHLGFSPERIDPGNQKFSLENTPKVVSGVGEEALCFITTFYETFVERTVPVSAPRVAEMTKLVENTFRLVNIALANELVQIGNELNVDVWEALDAAATKPYGFMRFTPGPGVGGHCIPVDPQYLTWASREHGGKAFRLGELAQDVNDSMPIYAVERLQSLLNERSRSVFGAKVLVLGVAYKKGVGDVRESPVLPMVERLIDLGAQVTVSDPHVHGWTKTPIIEADSVAHWAEDFDIVVVATDHDEFAYSEIARSAKVVLDCRNVVPPRVGNVFVL